MEQSNGIQIIQVNFSSNLFCINDVKQVIKDLMNIKSVARDIPTYILKECEFVFSKLVDSINISFETDTFLTD